MIQKTILLVEDDYLNRRYTRNALSEAGYHVMEARNVSEAKEMLQRHLFDVAVLDINLGENESNGITLGQFINEQTCIPFIYLTAYEVKDIMTSAIRTQPSSYLNKPLRPAELLAAIDISLKKTGEGAENKKYLIVKEEDFNIKVVIAEIDFFESEGNYVFIHTEAKIYRHRATIKQVLVETEGHGFVQIHRAFVANISKIEKYNSKNVVIKQHLLPISKNFQNEVNIKLEKTN